mmetsp:Transcript_10109/g.22465  ORF Transcript_10109/g.22465 Transcript_10109/m.22465 type:complete len:292 (-) Transcript_10109:148-1023(-)
MPSNYPTLWINEAKLMTSMKKNNFWYIGRGNMFDIKVKKKIHLVDIGVHKNYLMSRNLQVWVRKGSWKEAPWDRTKWTLLGTVIVSGGGKQVITEITDKQWLNFDMFPGQVYGIYIRYLDGSADLLTTPSKNREGVVYIRSKEMDLMTGVMVNGFFKGHRLHIPCEWHGSLIYQVYKSGPCQNNPAFRFNKIESRNCSRLEGLCDTRDRFKRLVRVHCPVTCGTCRNEEPVQSPTGNTIKPCKNNPEFRFSNILSRNCHTLKSLCNKRDRYKRLVKRYCPETCGICKSEQK